MPIFKCKMCGGTIEVNGNETVGVCEYCGSKQTLPRLGDDKKATLYDRADHYRRNNDYDKAMGIYEQILDEDKTDAEAYWSLVLCRYGIEYVEDPSTHKRIPTINRAQFTSVLADEDYKSALKYADISQKIIYEQEAKTIDDIQKGILQISSKEDPFDVFICYKETDNNGRRTQDSVLATDLYHQLTQEGFKVFFSRITLEDKLGTAYEPYIFAALNSAKVMVVLGTRKEYFNAVWVKNEWSRYLSLVKQSNGKKVLIPAYRDMDPYDLPEEFSHLQAQDMSKLGFMQDLIRGIKKIINVDNGKTSVVKETVVNNVQTNSKDTVSPLLERAFMFLEDGNWQEADAYCERVLDQEPKNGKAYLVKLMVELKVTTTDKLATLELPFDDYGNYKKAIRFGDEETKNILLSAINSIEERIENEKSAKIYKQALEVMKNADSEDKYINVSSVFDSISNYKDSKALSIQCLEKADECKKDKIYLTAVNSMKHNSLKNYENAISQFQSIKDWKDSSEKIVECQNKIDKINAKHNKKIARAENKVKRETTKLNQNSGINKKSVSKVLVCAICALIVIVAIVILFVAPNKKYNEAIQLMNDRKYDEAIDIFEEINNFKDSDDKMLECLYSKATELLNEENYEQAKTYFDNAKDYKDANEKSKYCQEMANMINRYNEGLELMNSENYAEAVEKFTDLNYKDSEELKAKCELCSIVAQYKDVSVGDIIKFGHYEQDNDTSNGQEEIEWQVLAKEEGKILVISKYILDLQPFHKSNYWDSWKNCTLRQWLNNDFLSVAFSENEISCILDTSIATEDDSQTDKIYILSCYEAESIYFHSDAERMSTFTEYVCAKDGIKRINCYWSRTKGNFFDFEGYAVEEDGETYAYDCAVYSYSGVRPILWIKTEF